MKTRAAPTSAAVPLRLLIIYAGIFAALFLVFAAIAHLLSTSQSASVPVPDEKAVAQELLEKKLSGPRYFQIGEPAPELPSPYITPSQAKAQLDRVVAERKLDDTERAKVEALIKELTEPSPSRMVGTERLNALQLNLALDELNPGK